MIDNTFYRNEKGYEEHFFPAGSVILDARSQTRLIYYVKSGYASLQVYTSDLRPGAWFPFSDGDFIGVIEAFSSYSYPVADIYALTDCVIQTAEIRILKERLEYDTKLAQMLLNNMAEQMMVNDRWILIHNTSTLLEHAIVSIATHYQKGSLDTLTKTRLSNELSAPKRSFNRALAEMKDMVIYKDKHFLVTNPDLLLSRANEILERFDLNT